MTNLKRLTPFASLFLFGVAIAVPNDPVSNGFQLAQVDYDTVHSVLVERCKSSSPDSVAALVAAIATWKAKNEQALKQLRMLSKNSLIKRLGLSESEASTQLARSSEFLTNALKSQFEQVSEPELKAACGGQYAAQSLASPTLDFNSLLAKMRGGNASPKVTTPNPSINTDAAR
jgi:hypothetical protein